MIRNMSLLEDLVELLRYVLEYFGVPPEMLVPVWNSPLCGQHRSIVRMIGTNLPLQPYPRVHFQIPLQAFRRQAHIDVSVDAPEIASLADVLWLAEDRGDNNTKFRSVVTPGKCGWQQGLESSTFRPECAAAGKRVEKPGTHPEALRKISALEEELLKLRAQIAMIVAAPPAGDRSLTPSCPATPCSTPLPAAAFTSTPVSAPPPPPPPLPPPPPAIVNSAQNSIKDMIRQRQAVRKTEAGTQQQQQQETQHGVTSSSSSLPSMMEVLKNMNQVKLRSVERSPGGTPVKTRRTRSKGASSSSDPATLIAEALKKKFSHVQRDESFDKENRSAEPSPFSSPDTPRVVHIKRRSHVRVYL